MSEAQKIEKKKIYDDILFMVNKIDEVHPCPYFNINKEKLMNKLKEFMNDDSINTKPQFLYFAHKIIKEFGDPHTSVENFTSIVPLKFRIINDRVFVIDANDEYKNLIGQELKSINGKNIEHIINELREIFSYTMPKWADIETQNNLSNLCSLWMLPSLENSENYTFLINDKEINFSIDQVHDYSGLIKPFYNFTIDYENKVINISYKRCRNDENYPFDKFVEDIKNTALLNGIDNFIVDIRTNQGGNSSIINPLIDFLEDKNVVTLVDNEVFSSGSLAAIDLRNIGSTIVGSHIGTTLNNFGECYKYTTPNLGINAYISQKYYFYDYEKNSVWSVKGKKEFTDFFAKSENKKHLIPQIFEPDIFVDYQFDDIFGNNMERIALQEIKQKQIHKY